MTEGSGKSKNAIVEDLIDKGLINESARKNARRRINRIRNEDKKFVEALKPNEKLWYTYLR